MQLKLNLISTVVSSKDPTDLSGTRISTLFFFFSYFSPQSILWSSFEMFLLSVSMLINFRILTLPLSLSHILDTNKALLLWVSLCVIIWKYCNKTANLLKLKKCENLCCSSSTFTSIKMNWNAWGFKLTYNIYLLLTRLSWLSGIITLKIVESCTRSFKSAPNSKRPEWPLLATVFFKHISWLLWKTTRFTVSKDGPF